MQAWPQAARDYVAKVQELTGLNILSVSVGPNRAETIVLDDAWH